MHRWSNRTSHASRQRIRRALAAGVFAVLLPWFALANTPASEAAFAAGRSTYPFWHTEPIEVISEPRGFPDDMNPIYKEYFGYNEHPESNYSIIHNALFHSKQQYLTWFLVQEVIDYDWDRKFPPWTAYVKNQYSCLFDSLAPFPESFPNDEFLYLFDGEGRTEVSWVESYREFVGSIDWFLEELLKLGEPEKVRIIFWLN